MSTLYAPPGQQSPTRPATDATRHLCAGVYTDEKFRDLVIREVCTNPSRRVPPSYGFDLVPVMRHAWWATHLSAAVRIATLTSVAVPLTWGHITAAAITTCGFTLLVLLNRAITLSAVLTRPEDPVLAVRKHKPKRRRLSLPGNGWTDRQTRNRLKRTGMIALALVLAMAVLSFNSPDQAALAGALFGAVAAITVLAATVRQIRVNRLHKDEILRPTALSHRESIVAEQQEHPCVIYRRPAHTGEGDEEDAVFTLFGDESPFIGAGELVHQWNPPMNIQLLRPGTDTLPLHQREHRKPPFATHELVDHLRDAVADLHNDEENVRLPVETHDRVYVAEAGVSTDRSLLADPLSRSGMNRIIDNQSPDRQHFLEVSVPGAGSELVATTFLQVIVRGRTLTLSFAACALTRTPDRFHKAEEYGQRGKRAVASAGIRSLCSLPSQATNLWRLIQYPYVLAKAAWFFRRERTLTPIRNVSISSRLSIRQEHTQEWGKVQLDKIHVLSQMKNVERRLLKATSDFLSSRGVDISEFDDRATQIINSGILNLGGSNDFTNTAFGNQNNFHGNGSQQPPENPQNGNTA